MKTKEKKKEFKTVTIFRDVKEQISKQIQRMTFEEQKEYFNNVRAGKIKTKSVK